jgi:outer membrane receptor protein involved in Fe transport
MTKSAFYGVSTVSALALLASAGFHSSASAQTVATTPDQIPVAQTAAPTAVADIVVTGSRIPRTGLTSTSPVVSTTAEDIKLQEALSVEDFSTKLPQLAGGVRDTAQGSDSFGATVFDLRNLGQSRTLILIDGTRAVPFSFRNSVDVSSIPASLIKQVDVLTGGAAAVYGADAVAGVVNFILNDNFNGVQISATDRTAQAGGSEYGGSLTVGGPINDRGHVEFAFDYTQRDEVTAGSRSWAATPNATVAPVGGNFTDVASGRKFSFDSNGLFTTTPQTSNFSSEYPLVEPLKRYNLATFFNYKLTDRIELYGRGMYTNAQSVESGTAGPNPVAVNQVVGINQTNPYLTPQIASQLTFVNGVAQVNVNKTLGELGLINYHTERDTAQYQLGLRGPLTPNIKWNDYVQYGRVTEVSPITGDGLVTNASGQNNFSLLANSVNLFGPTNTGLSSLGSTLQGNNRTRDQFVTAGTISGTSADLYSLPAGPVGFSIGYEYRRETAAITQDTALLDGDTYREGSLAAYSGAVTTKELYAETLVPILKDMFLAKQLDVGYAFRYSDYSLFGSHNTSKFEFNYAPTSDIHFRGSIQRVIRAPNFGEFAATESSLPYYDLITVARLTPRYAGDPCVLGTGNAAQCARFGAPAVGSVNSFSPSYLEGNYYYGGNAAIQPEKGITKTFGMVLTPSFLKRFSATIDYYEVNLYGAIGVIQPVNDLTSCYITNPVANNPLCALAPRDPTNGHLENAYVNNQNLGRIDQQGIDIGVTYSVPVPAWLPGDLFRFNYQGNVVTRYTIQSNPTVAAIDCKGTFGATCSSDATTLVQPDYRHNANVSWVFARAQVQLNWQRIGGVRDSAPGTTDKIPDQDYYDINASYKIRPWLTADVGVHNLLDKDPPFVKGSATFNTFPDTYDVMGRTFAISLTAKY